MVSGWLGRDVWLGPPVEVWARFELIVIENATALGHDVLEISKRREVLVGEWLVADRPEGACPLEPRRGPARGAQPAEARASMGASRRAGCLRAQPGWARCANRRCRAKARSCARV